MLFGATVDVMVGTGEAQRSFTLHSNVIVTRSSFFAARMKDNWNHSGGPVQLHDEDPQIFDAYLTVLYCNEAKFTDNDLNALCEDEIDTLQLLLSKVYILADKLGDCKSANLAIDSFIDIANTSEFATLMTIIAYIYENAPSTSPLHKLCAEHSAHCIEWATITKAMREDAPRAFLLDDVTEKDLCIENDGGALARNTEFLDNDAEALKRRYHQHDHLHPRPSD